MFGSFYMGALAMAALLGSVQWLVGDETLDPPRTTTLRMGWAAFFAGLGVAGLIAPRFLRSDPIGVALGTGVVLALAAGLRTRMRLANRPEAPDNDLLPDEHTIEVESADDA